MHTGLHISTYEVVKQWSALVMSDESCRSCNDLRQTMVGHAIYHKSRKASADILQGYFGRTLACTPPHLNLSNIGQP